MVATIIIAALIFGYCAYLVRNMYKGMKSGKGNPYSCTGDCTSCHGGCHSHK
ncbi:MAG: FeoB-associated Cys-rich membrane protein [Butyrivibrio sp.]|uniref:FeoB-associated Cys-rich membrane protein n=1 Tax=Butyrivibrio sp. TaxID=28121 RepID=UPI0025EFFBE9|nr:FeoB-associated Cys-rich membrane protein [Butyrivibrio sp.]MCR5773372.1 FeoB-associated Cys-rich membrane protein [Butyrivibrio sp.]